MKTKLCPYLKNIPFLTATCWGGRKKTRVKTETKSSSIIITKLTWTPQISFQHKSKCLPRVSVDSFVCAINVAILPQYFCNITAKEPISFCSWETSAHYRFQKPLVQYSFCLSSLPEGQANMTRKHVHILYKSDLPVWTSFLEWLSRWP